MLTTVGGKLERCVYIQSHARVIDLDHDTSMQVALDHLFAVLMPLQLCQRSPELTAEDHGMAASPGKGER